MSRFTHLRHNQQQQDTAQNNPYKQHNDIVKAVGVLVAVQKLPWDYSMHSAAVTLRHMQSLAGVCLEPFTRQNIVTLPLS